VRSSYAATSGVEETERGEDAVAGLDEEVAREPGSFSSVGTRVLPSRVLRRLNERVLLTGLGARSLARP
jgi:hypothetical protein